MGKLAMKEIVAIMQIIAAVLALIAMCLMSMVLSFPDDLWCFIYECALSTTMVLNLLFGCSTWFYNSNYAKTRHHVRIFILTNMWLLCVADIAASVPFILQFVQPLLYGHFEKDIFDVLDYILVLIAMGVGCCVSLLMLIICVILTITLKKKGSKHK